MHGDVTGQAGHGMNSYRKLGFALLLLLLVRGLPAQATSTVGSQPARPDVRSQAYYIFDGSNSAVLASRHENTPAPIASITKLMTALVVLEADQSMDEMLTITAADVRGTAGSGSRLWPGARLSRNDLLQLALMSSENRAAHALCRSYPKGLTACVR
ncbi:MAG TPA: serine hydrolase, partial [Steroidobacteraceae bacterium]